MVGEETHTLPPIGRYQDLTPAKSQSKNTKTLKNLSKWPYCNSTVNPCTTAKSMAKWSVDIAYSCALARNLVLHLILPSWLHRIHLRSVLRRRVRRKRQWTLSLFCMFVFVLLYILFFQGYDEWGSKRLESLQGRSEALGKVLTFLRSLILRNRLERGSTASPPAASDYKLSEVLRLGLWQVNECVYDDFWNLQGFDPQNTVA